MRGWRVRDENADIGPPGQMQVTALAEDVDETCVHVLETDAANATAG